MNIFWIVLGALNLFFAYGNLVVVNPKRFFLGGVNLAAGILCLSVALTH